MTEASSSAVRAYTRGSVFLPDGTLARKSVLVRGSRIVGIVADEEIPEGADRVDCTGRTILPGLIDLHAHPSIHCRLDNGTAVRQIAYSTRHVLRMLRAGITTIRAMGGHGDVDLVLGELADSGMIPGPRVLSGGRFICMTGGHAAENGIEVDGVDEMRKVVREEIHTGHRWIKLMCSGGFDDPSEAPTALQFAPDEVAAAVREATVAGARVAAHAHGAAAITMAVEAGAHSIEHGSFVDEGSAQAMIDHDAFLVPTFSTYENVAARADHPMQQHSIDLLKPKTTAFRMAVEKGVKWGLGSDAQGGSPLELLLDEIVILVEDVGLDPAVVLQHATRGNAELLGLSDVGAIEEGFVADLTIVDGDPLARINDIARVVTTVRDGRHYDWEVLAPALNLWTLQTLEEGDAPDGRRTPSRLWDLKVLP